MIRSLALFLLLAAAKIPSTKAFASIDQTVRCGDPEVTGGICRGELEFYSPSPVMPDPSNPDEEGMATEVPDFGYAGGWSWIYTFVYGLPDDTFFDIYSDPSMAAHIVGDKVTVRLEDDQVTCTVSVGDEVCQSCELCNLGDWESEAQGATFSADCTNLQKVTGKQMECAPTLPIFYPQEPPEGLGDMTFVPSPSPQDETSVPSPSPTFEVTGEGYFVTTVSVKPKLTLFFQKGHDDLVPNGDEISILQQKILAYMEDMLQKEFEDLDDEDFLGVEIDGFENSFDTQATSSKASDKFSLQQFKINFTANISLGSTSENPSTRDIASLLAKNRNLNKFVSDYARFADDGEPNGLFYYAGKVKARINGLR